MELGKAGLGGGVGVAILIFALVLFIFLIGFVCGVKSERQHWVPVTYERNS